MRGVLGSSPERGRARADALAVRDGQAGQGRALGGGRGGRHRPQNGLTLSFHFDNLQTLSFYRDRAFDVKPVRHLRRARPVPYPVTQLPELDGRLQRQSNRQAAYRELGWRTAVSFIAPENMPSQRVAQRLGATYERDVRLMITTAGIYRHPGPEALNSNRSDQR